MFRTVEKVINNLRTVDDGLPLHSSVVNKEKKDSGVNFLRYPGGKQRLMQYILPLIKIGMESIDRYIEPFVGGGAVFFSVNPEKAFLSDLNSDLIDLYIGIRKSPKKVWDTYQKFPNTKEGYYSVRSKKNSETNIVLKAAILLYLNRTCFKGMWRQNLKGEFTVGYGGQDRRWVISEKSLTEVSKKLANASVIRSDFEPIISGSNNGDFLFLDPPYKPFYRDIVEAHYVASKFTYENQTRLARTLLRATERGVKWAMTNSSHQNIIEMYEGHRIIPLPKGTGSMPGILTSSSGEVLILNY